MTYGVEISALSAAESNQLMRFNPASDIWIPKKDNVNNYNQAIIKTCSNSIPLKQATYYHKW
jgi:hypothetical protein